MMMFEHNPSQKYRQEAEKKVNEIFQQHQNSDLERLAHELRIHQVELEMQNLELRETQQRLQESLDYISCLYHQSPVGFITIDIKGGILDLNESMAAMLGRSPQQAQRKFLAEFCTKDSAQVLRQRLPALFSQPEGKIVNLALKGANQSTIDIELQARRLPDGEHLACSIIDRTESRRAEHALIEKTAELKKTNMALKQLATVFTHAREGIVITDPAGTILDVNQAFCRITGYQRHEAVGHNPRLLKSGKHDPEFYTEMWQTLLSTGSWSGEIYNRRKDGTIFPVQLTISSVSNKQGKIHHFVALHTDISVLIDYQKQLELLAHYDALTGLPNRKLFDDRLQQAMAHCKRYDQSLALAYLDLDGFKSINDNFGHAAGDHLLKAIGTTMKKSLRESDTISRFGGDEFVVILVDQCCDHASSPYVERLLTAAAQPVDYEGHTLQVTASMGVALWNSTNIQAPEQLLKQADQALYRAKLSGGNSYHFHSGQ